MDKATRRFEFKDDKSAKFWEITQTSNTVTVRYGKTGTNGQTQEKAFADAAAAGKHAAKLIAEKLGKGYIEQGNAPVIGADAPAAPEVPVEKAPKPGAESVAKKVPVKAAKAQPVKSAKPKNPAQDPEATPESLMAMLNKDDATNRLLAKHPRASSKLLEKLSHSSDQATRRAVAGNPNTPPQIYVRLGQQFPKEFLANPMLDLLLMENPALMVEVPEALLIRLLKQADCPISLLVWAAGHGQEKVQLAVAMNVNAPEQALEKLRTSRHSAVEETVQARSGAEIEQDPEKEFEQVVRKRLGSLTHADLHEAWSAGDIGLAQWSALPLSFRLLKTTKDAFSWIDGCMLPLPVLEALAKESERKVRRGVAGNPSTPVPMLETLAKDSDLDVRSAVAGRPSATGPVLEVLAKDLEWRVRREVGTNPSAPVSLLEALAKDSDLNVRSAVAGNPATPVAMLELLAKDSDDGDVRSKAAGNPSAPALLLKALAKYVTFREAVAKNSTAPASELEVLAKDSHEEVRAGVASNPATPAPVLGTLAIDSDESVRLAVAKNPSAVLPVLEALVKDSTMWVRLAVAGNPSATVAMLEMLAKDSDENVRAEVASNPATPVLMLEALAKDSKKRVHLAVASNPATPVPVLMAMAKDTDGNIRRSVIKNPKLTQEMLEEMVQSTEDESDWAALLAHPNLCAKSAELIADKLFTSPPWYRYELSKASAEVVEAARAGSVLSYFGKDPNKAVLAKRPVAPLMALCVGPFVEPSRIVKVVGSTDWLIRAAVARNPGTPPNLLKTLAADTHPLVAALARRPSETGATQAALADPGASSPTLSLDLTRAQAEVWARCKKEEPVGGAWRATVMDPVWSERADLSNVLWGLQQALHRIDDTLVAACDRLDAQQQALMWQVAVQVPHAEVRQAIAQSGACPQVFFTLLAQETEPQVLMAALSNPACMPTQRTPFVQTLLKLHGNKLELVIQDPRAPIELLEAKAKSKDWSVRSSVARKSSTPAQVLQTLAGDKESWVRRSVAGNPSTPAQVLQTVLQTLAGDKEEEVRSSVAGNPATPAQVLQTLAGDKKEDVRVYVAGNPATPAQVLQTLAGDKEARVRSSVAENPATPAQVLQTLAGDKEASVRRSVVGNPNTPVSLLQGLASDVAYAVAKAAIFNPSTPNEVREQFEQGWLTRLQRAARRELCRREGNAPVPSAPVTAADLLRALGWLNVLLAPETDNKNLTKASRSTDWLTRLGAALHPQASAGILKLLCQDRDADVASAAQWRSANPGVST